MESATLTQLLAQVRAAADVEAFAARYPSTLLTPWINQGIIAYRELVGGGASRVLRTLDDASIAAGGDLHADMSDFVRILAVAMTDDNANSWYRLDELTSSSDLTRGEDTIQTTTLTSGTPGRPLWWRWDGADLYWYPHTDRDRLMRIVGELGTTALVNVGDAFESLVPRGVEYVATFAALKLLARDNSSEQYALLNNELQRCEASIRRRARDFTGGTPRRRDTRGERAVDRGERAFVWPPYL